MGCPLVRVCPLGSTHRRKEYGGGESHLIIIANQYYIKLSVIYGNSRQIGVAAGALGKNTIA